MRTLILGLLLVSFALPVKADSSACPLTGLVAVYVNVVVENDAKTGGVDQATYLAKVNAMLQTANIATTQDQSAPWLNIDVNGVQAKAGGPIALSIRTKVLEDATLPRTGVKDVVITTWDESHVAISGAYDANDEVSECVTDQINDFTADFEKDNPKS